jgi:hypothetical protein
MLHLDRKRREEQRFGVVAELAAVAAHAGNVPKMNTLVIVALVDLGLADLDGDGIVVGVLAGDKAFVSSAGTVLR